MAQHPQSARGFTLVEVLVVMVIVGLLSVLLVEGLRHGVQLRDRVLEHTEHQREDVLRRAWFSDAVASLVADLDELEDHRFHGTEAGFSGMTLAALDAPAGEPVYVRWAVEEEDDIFHLFYTGQDGARQRIWSWRAESARFSFYDPEMGWIDEWPPGQSLGPEAPALPAAIRFETEWRGRPRSWIATVRGPRQPRDGLIPPEMVR